MRKLIICILFVFIIFPQIAFAQGKDKINLYFFYGDGCPHCAKEEKFLNLLKKENANIAVFSFETWHDKDNQSLLTKIGKELGITVRGVPLLVIGDQAITGYYDDATTGQQIKKIIDSYVNTGCNDIVAPLLSGAAKQPICAHGCENNNQECLHDCGCQADFEKNSQEQSKSNIQVPFLGEINPANFSLPILTLIMAAIDGFNPCAMWALLFLINLLLNMKDKTKMRILGSAFIVSSAAVYFIFLAAWLNIVMFMGFVGWIRSIIAVAAITSGAWHLRSYFKNRGKGCEVTKSEKRQAVFKNLRRIILEKNFWPALSGIIVLAALINIVELFCSAGIPAVYVPILTMAGLPAWQYYAYLLFYIFIFMLDDLVIFFIAMKTLEIKTSDSKYMRYSSLIGGVILLIIGILLLIKPGLLMFG